MISPVGAAAHNVVADGLEVAGYLDYIDPIVAILMQVTHPFGTQVIAIALGSRKKPIYYYRLLERNGIEILGIEFFGLPKIGTCIANGCACVIVKNEQFEKAVKLLEKHGAFIVY
jgi:hypothetical protein